MPERPEIPTEVLHEHIHHQAEHSGERWISGVALSTAILAVLAAIVALLAGEDANHALVGQVQSANQWSYYQSKSIKAAIFEAKPNPTDDEKQRLARYEHEKEEIKGEAEKRQHEAEHHLHRHEALSRGVTMFQVAIAVAAVSALTRRRAYWFLSLALGGAGVVLSILAFIQSNGGVPGAH